MKESTNQDYQRELLAARPVCQLGFPGCRVRAAQVIRNRDGRTSTACDYCAQYRTQTA